MYEKIAQWCMWGLWSAQMVDQAVGRGVLTAEEGEQIKTGARA